MIIWHKKNWTSKNTFNAVIHNSVHICCWYGSSKVFVISWTQGRVVSLQRCAYTSKSGVDLRHYISLDPTMTQNQSTEWTLRNSDGKMIVPWFLSKNDTRIFGRHSTTPWSRLYLHGWMVRGVEVLCKFRIWHWVWLPYPGRCLAL